MISEFNSNESVFSVHGQNYYEEEHVNQISLGKSENKSNLGESKNNYLNIFEDSKQKNSIIINKFVKSTETNSLKEKNSNNMNEEKNKLEEKMKNENSINSNKLNYTNNRNDGNQLFFGYYKIPKKKFILDDYIRRNENYIPFSNDISNSFASFFSQKLLNQNNYFNLYNNKINSKNTSLDEYSGQAIMNPNEKNLFDGDSPELNIKQDQFKKNEINLGGINLDDKCFPFTSGRGIINMTSIMKNEDITENDDNINEIKNGISNENKNSYTNNDLYLIKFTTKKYFINEYGKKRRIIKKRKYKPDTIIKKIKSRFHKILKNIINTNLKKAGSKKLFYFLPLCFVANISKKINVKYFDLTYKDLLLNDFTTELNKTNDYKNKEIDRIRCIKNREVVDYLEKNQIISEKSGFDKLKEMKYKDILNNYFISKEFEDSLNAIRNEKEEKEYLQSYIYQAKNYIKFFMCYFRHDKKIIEKDDKQEENKKEEEEDDDDDYISED